MKSQLAIVADYIEKQSLFEVPIRLKVAEPVALVAKIDVGGEAKGRTEAAPMLS